MVFNIKIIILENMFKLNVLDIISCLLKTSCHFWKLKNK